MTNESNIVQLADIPDESTEDLNWKETHRIGVAEFAPETMEIKLHVFSGPTTYNIDLEKDDALIDWLRHLNDKNWATSQVLGDLVKCWFRVDEETAVER